EQHQISMDDYIIPQGGFKHFNDFFYRKIKPEARPINKGVVSPADGRVVVFPKITDIQKFFVKGKEFNLKTFLQDDTLTQDFTNGSMCNIRLAPLDYQRFHFPVEGIASASKVINGAY